MVRIGSVDHVKAGIRAADVDLRALPGDSPDRLAEVAEIDAVDIDALQVLRGLCTSVMSQMSTPRPWIVTV